MTIYDIAENLGEAFPRAFTSENITADFKATGFWPFDRDVFGDDEFLSSYVTDPPPPPRDEQQCEQVEGDDDIACLTPEHVSPHEAIPSPKAPPRKNRAVVRKKGQTISSREGTHPG